MRSADSRPSLWAGMCATANQNQEPGPIDIDIDEGDIPANLRGLRAKLDKLLEAQEKFVKLLDGQERLEAAMARVLRELPRRERRVPSRESDQYSEHDVSEEPPQSRAVRSFGVASVPMEDLALNSMTPVTPLDSSSNLRLRKQLVRRQTAKMSMTAPDTMPESEMVGRGYKKRCNFPVHPDSRTRAMFDVLSVLVLLYESILLPIQISWQLQFEGWILASGIFTLVFWSIDLVLGFATGFRRGNKLVLGFKDIAKRYCMTYFIPNLAIVVADLVGVFIEIYGDERTAFGASTIAKVARVIKLNRLLRLVSMFRTGKVAMAFDQLVAQMRKWSLANQFNFSVRVIKLVCLILWVNHFGACVWYSVFSLYTIEQWKESNDINNKTETGQYTDFFHYLLGFYWSTSSMIAGESIMMPTTMGELGCTMFFIMFGFIFSSIMISSLLTTVMDYNLNNKERSNKLKILRQFLYQHNVKSKICMPIEKQVNDRIWRVKRLSEKDVAALSLISPVMRAELSVNIYGPSIRLNRFIRTCESLEMSFIKNISFWALKHEAYEPGTHIFEPNIEADGIKYVSWGTLEYLPMHKQAVTNSIRTYPSTTRPFSEMGVDYMPSEDMDPVPTPGVEIDNNSRTERRRGQSHVKKHTWFCEVALFAHWTHRGWMDATTPCEVLTVLSQPFLDVLTGHPELLALAREYGAEIGRAAESKEPDLLDDLKMPIEHEAIVCAMPLASRAKMSEGALQFLYDRDQWKGRLFQHHGFEELEKEIAKGDCDLLIYPSKPNKEETVLRVVTIVALRLQNSEGQVLAQIGKFVRGVIIPRCTYPGTKQSTGELPEQAVERMLETKLKALKAGVTINHRRTGQDRETRTSAKYGVNSVYYRTLFRARFEDAGYNRRVLERKNTQTLTPSVIAKRSILDSSRRAFTLEEMSNADSTFIFAWLSDEEFLEFTQEGKGEKDIERWLKGLEIDHLSELSSSQQVV